MSIWLRSSNDLVSRQSVIIKKKTITQFCNTAVHHLDQHDVVVKRPVSVLVVPDDQGDGEPLLEALHLHDAVLPKDHLHHVTPADKRGREKQQISNCSHLNNHFSHV